MLRGLIALLLLANLVFYAWTQGWLDNVVGARAIGDREPERLARQVRPETIRILSAGAASDASVAAPVCLEAGPYADTDIATAQAAVQSALPPGSWVSVRTEQPGAWIVYMGKYANQDSLTKKEDELKRRKLPFEEIHDAPALAPGLSLGRYAERAAAEQALQQFTQQGIRTARVVELTPASASHMLRVDKADPVLAAQVSALKADALGKGFAACARPAGS